MKNIRLLVIDDSSEFSFLLASLLKFHKIHVDSETRPEIACERIENENYDLIITDYMMEPLNGIEVAQKIRSSTLNSKTKIILVSAKKLDAEEMRELNIIEATYIMKPIMPNDLYKKIMELVG